MQMFMVRPQVHGTRLDDFGHVGGVPRCMLHEIIAAICKLLPIARLWIGDVKLLFWSWKQTDATDILLPSWGS